MFCLSGFVASVFIVAVIVNDVTSKEPPLAKGRIKALDDVLRMYGQYVNDGKGLKYAIEEAKRLSQNPDYNQELANYYVEMLELIESTGSAKVVQEETDRLNVIITSASNQPGAKGEIDYAITRRNILGAFVDAAAEYVMHGMMHSPDGGFRDL